MNSIGKSLTAALTLTIVSVLGAGAAAGAEHPQHPASHAPVSVTAPAGLLSPPGTLSTALPPVITQGRPARRRPGRTSTVRSGWSRTNANTQRLHRIPWADLIPGAPEIVHSHSQGALSLPPVPSSP
ncbi:hypothetical protein J2S98_004397 [Arthrobacter oryzae]|nr:hypothetical protein [Arthrobacter oryzae]